MRTFCLFAGDVTNKRFAKGNGATTTYHSTDSALIFTYMCYIYIIYILYCARVCLLCVLGWRKGNLQKKSKNIEYKSYTNLEKNMK